MNLGMIYEYILLAEQTKMTMAKRKHLHTPTHTAKKEHFLRLQPMIEGTKRKQTE